MVTEKKQSNPSEVKDTVLLSMLATHASSSQSDFHYFKIVFFLKLYIKK